MSLLIFTDVGLPKTLRRLISVKFQHYHWWISSEWYMPVFCSCARSLSQQPYFIFYLFLCFHSPEWQMKWKVKMKVNHSTNTCSGEMSVRLGTDACCCFSLVWSMFSRLCLHIQNFKELVYQKLLKESLIRFVLTSTKFNSCIVMWELRVKKRVKNEQTNQNSLSSDPINCERKVLLKLGRTNCTKPTAHKYSFDHTSNTF